MKIEKIVCDRCKNDMSPYIRHKYKLTVRNKLEVCGQRQDGMLPKFVESNVDLCEDCQNELKEWLENGTERL